MRDGLGDSSRLFINYEKTKKEAYEEEKARVEGEINDSNEVMDDAAKEALIEEKMGEYQCLYTYLEKNLLNIQITDDKNSDQTLYFPKYPVFSSLSGNLRDYIMKNVNRASHRDKIVSLLGYTDAVKEKIEYSYNLKKF